jgi:DNA-3-methyladenine glycosylase II
VGERERFCDAHSDDPVYLLMALGRPDVWPSGDRALVVAARELKRLDHDPTPGEFEQLGEAWRPWRAVAARLLWHHYLSTPRRPRVRQSFREASDTLPKSWP